MEKGKPKCPEKKISEQRREPTTNSTHIWRRVRESGPHWWEASALTTAPSLLPLIHLLTKSGVHSGKERLNQVINGISIQIQHVVRKLVTPHASQKHHRIPQWGASMQAFTLYTRANTGVSEVSLTFWDLWLHKYILSAPKASEFPSGDIVSTFGLLCKKRAQLKVSIIPWGTFVAKRCLEKSEIKNLFVS